MTFFTVGVTAVLALAALFVPQATIQLDPISRQQSVDLIVDIDPTGNSGMFTGEAAAQELTVTVTGSKSSPIASQAVLPKGKASGTVVFQNLTLAPLVLPSGTIVYSAAPQAVRFATMEEAQLPSGTSAFVEVRIEAVEAGAAGNVEVDSITGVEGHLSAMTAVRNKAATAGGSDEVASLPTQADREALRAALLGELLGQAEQELRAGLGPNDVALPASLQPVAVESELFDPPAGRPASVLSLVMTVRYRMSYVRDSDLESLARMALDAELPAGFVEREGTLNLTVDASTATVDSGDVRLKILAERTVAREIDRQAANVLARGKSRAQAVGELEAALPVQSPPSIRLSPSWWPWLPLIPFRIEVALP